MKSLSIHQPFDVAIYEKEVWDLDPHQHNFYEIIYIIEGDGLHIINENKVGYTAKSLFLITPKDTHYFKVNNKTTFCIITFTEIYFTQKTANQGELRDFSELFKNIEIILYNMNTTTNEIIFQKEDKIFAEFLVNQILYEAKQGKYFHDIITQNIVFLLLNLIARNVLANIGERFTNLNAKSIVHQIIIYIQKNIYNNEKLSLKSIAEEFSKSTDYIGQYFKNQTGESIKNYILDYKLNLVTSRLLNSDYTISEIAYEVGFTDESHLNKTFKKLKIFYLSLFIS